MFPCFTKKNEKSSFFSIFATMNVITLTELDSPQLDVFSRLTEAQLRNRLEPEKGIFIAESLKVVRVALENGLQPLSFLAEHKYVEQQIAPLFNSGNPKIKIENPDIPVYTGSREMLSSLTGYEVTRGVLCAMQRPHLPSVGEICTGKKRIAVMDSVVNSTNTGAIFRAATALGIEAILLTPTCCDPLNRRSIRVSMGTVFQLPWCFLDTQSYPESLRRMGFKTVALALNNKAISIDDHALQRIERMAILMGTEGDGLSPSIIDSCDYVVKIPMQHGVDSLNVAAAASIAFWQLRN